MEKMMTRPTGNRGGRTLTTARSLLAAMAAVAAMGAACWPASGSDPSKIIAVGAENEYANVIAQIGGPYVSVSAIESNPNTDPHTFEASAQVASEVSAAQLVVENGVGYDSWIDTILLVVPQFLAQADRRADPAGPAQQHPQPTPLVRAHHHARGRHADRR